MWLKMNEPGTCRFKSLVPLDQDSDAMLVHLLSHRHFPREDLPTLDSARDFQHGLS